MRTDSRTGSAVANLQWWEDSNHPQVQAVPKLMRDPAHTLTTRRLSALRRVAGAGNFSARKPMPGIIIDPLRAWGNPTAGRSRIQWFALASPVNAGDPMREVAAFFIIPLRRVVAAWRYDRLRACRPHYGMMELAGKLQMARYWEAQGREEGGL